MSYISYVLHAIVKYKYIILLALAYLLIIPLVGWGVTRIGAVGLADPADIEMSSTLSPTESKGVKGPAKRAVAKDPARSGVGESIEERFEPRDDDD